MTKEEKIAAIQKPVTAGVIMTNESRNSVKFLDKAVVKQIFDVKTLLEVFLHLRYHCNEYVQLLSVIVCESSGIRCRNRTFADLEIDKVIITADEFSRIVAVLNQEPQKAPPSNPSDEVAFFYF